MSANFTFQALDDNGVPMPLLGYRQARLVTAGAAAARLALSSGTRVITIRPVGGAIVWAIGDGTIVAAPPVDATLASGHYLADGEPLDIALSDAKSQTPASHLSVRRVGAADVPVYVSERG